MNTSLFPSLCQELWNRADDGDRRLAAVILLNAHKRPTMEAAMTA